jgi:hypothetical protein
MFNEIETTPTAAEVEAMLTAMDLFLAREADYQAELATCSNSFEAHWAGSASASVHRDYRAGRVVTIKARRQ